MSKIIDFNKEQYFEKMFDELLDAMTKNMIVLKEYSLFKDDAIENIHILRRKPLNVVDIRLKCNKINNTIDVTYYEFYGTIAVTDDLKEIALSMSNLEKFFKELCNKETINNEFLSKWICYIHYPYLDENRIESMVAQKLKAYYG